MIPFVKADAFGNDFLVIEEKESHGQHAALAKKLCARSTIYGGADGIEFWEKRPDGTFFLRLFNSDGSEAELSGNGTRCVAAWLAFKKLAFKETVVPDICEPAILVTHGGPRVCRLVRAEGTHFWMETEMGVPKVSLLTIDVPGIGPVDGTYVDVGNPHFVLFVENENFSKYGRTWQELGAMICIHPAFPNQTNVEFVLRSTGTEIAFRIYERGCGPTTSSGTGTCASVAASLYAKRTADRMTAYAEGGSQWVRWEATDKPMLLTGEADIITVGEVAAL